MESLTPVIKLTDYQKESVADRSRFRIDLWSRQSGKTFASALHYTLGAALQGEKWVILSSGERMSKENIGVCQMHARAINVGIDFLEPEFKAQDGSTYKMQEIRFPSGGRIQGLPANPMTARGHSANLGLDEFSTHKDSRGIWAGVFGAITRGFRIRIQFTPLGRKNKAYELWTSWSKHMAEGVKGYKTRLLTIYDAIAGGLELKDPDGEPCAPEDLERALGDDELWAQEYLCEFLDEASAFIPYDLINECEDPEIEILPPWAALLLQQAQAGYERYRETKQEIKLATSETFAGVEFGGELLLGMDIARNRDLTVLWLDEKIGRTTRPAAIIALRRTPFYQQKLILHALLSLPNLRRFCGDKSGLGAQLCEQAQEVFGSWKVEPVDFTTANKEALAGRFKESLEDRRRVLPADANIRNSIHSVKRYSTPTGHFRFDAERTEQTGHADYFWAAALAEMAAGQQRAEFDFSAAGERRSWAGRGMGSFVSGSMRNY